jgi:hypothetical protein
MITNPNMLPKVRSKALRQECEHMPCDLRLSTFIGLPCSGNDTVVGAHLPIFGKGMSTKVTDLGLVAGCMLCHALLDASDPRGLMIRQEYPHAYWEQVIKAAFATLSRQVLAKNVVVPGAKII